MTLIRHFMLKSVFIDGLTRFFRFPFRDNYVKTNENRSHFKYRPIEDPLLDIGTWSYKIAHTFSYCKAFPHVLPIYPLSFA